MGLLLQNRLVALILYSRWRPVSSASTRLTTAHREGLFPDAHLTYLGGLYGFAMTLTRDCSEAEALV